ncbi:MAG: ATP synthase F1 subunit epsilon [Clostridia bacterium]|nr:ATP synthase F1 subunit epsilon [Clostridia bacterium]
MNTFELRFLAAEKPIYEGECISLVIPTISGQYGVQAMHYNMTAAIVPGLLKLTLPDGAVMVAAVSEGIIKVEDNVVLVLVDTAERPEEIDENRAKRAAVAAHEAILQKKSIQDYNMAQAKMARALNRLRVKRRSIN